MFYSAGLPFNLAKNPHFIKSYNLAANSSVSGYTPLEQNCCKMRGQIFKVCLKLQKAHKSRRV
ncbi:hypothetical protein ACS0TY_013721 [Phlomoides rotata]